ncbi:Hpt domain-containing protein [Pelagicoccus sp. NFK12]|uniref:Hpt domain-containing protein n=1 Tax=Pelagicoccus enzymogenes TaxID=2773457 RepID=A0A927IJT0_9BACT|nr:Hpt domain-containing protein [Pelagicoccus enzymogenes]MBD5782128.1 Hpt domain-containing protein [Pelagicoccus enzymogenes]
MAEPAFNPTNLFDLESLKSRLMGDEELVAQVLEACVPDINANFRDFALAIQSGEVETATVRIHAMKGASQNADLVAVSELTQQIESSLRAGDTEFARQSVDRLEELVGQTIGEVRRYLNN